MVQQRIKEMLGCDLRSLAFFRISLACLVIADAFVRYPSAEAFYSADGFFDAYMAKQMSPDGVSLNYLSDHVGFQRGIFLALAGAGFLLLAGLYTRVATFACWVILASIHVRNPLYIIGGDTLLRMLLFWSLFVPLGSVWSFDSRRRTNRERTTENDNQLPLFVVSVGTACLLLQVLVMYWTAGLSKWNEPWLSGNAMDYILRQDCYARPLSGWLLSFDFLPPLLSYGTLVAELLLPFALFVPCKTPMVRMMLVAFFWCFHLGIAMTMDVAKFTYVAMAAWIPFIPSFFWERVPWTQLTEVEEPHATSNGRHHGKRLRRWVRCGLMVILPFILLVYVLIWNFAGLFDTPGRTWLHKQPSSFYRFGNMTMLKQNFHMFCVPARTNTTYLYNGRTVSGERIDLVRRQPSGKTGPGSPLPAERHWMVLHWRLISFGATQELYDSLLRYRSEVWNREAGTDDRITQSRLERFVEEYGPDIEPGSFEHVVNVSQWVDSETPATSDEQVKSDEQMKKEFGQLLDQLDSDNLFPQD